MLLFANCWGVGFGGVWLSGGMVLCEMCGSQNYRSGDLAVDVGHTCIFIKYL